MRNQLAVSVLSAALAPVSLSQTSTWSQSTDNTTIIAGSAACLNNPGGITDNSFWRNYDPVACGVSGDYEVFSVTFGVEDSTTTSGSFTITVNLRDGTGFPVGAGAAPILGTTQVAVLDTDVTMQTFETATFDPPVFVPAGTRLAVEIMAPSGQPQGDFFFLGSNPLGETPTSSSYVSADACGIIDPIPFAAVGFPALHAIIDVEAAPFASSIGAKYCSPAVPNSTNQPGIITALGSAVVMDNDVVLRAEQLPPGQFAYFLASQTQGMMIPPGSAGVLCVGGNTGRFNQPAQIVQGPVGSIQLDLNSLPVNPPQPALPGETWNFQCWYRDASLGNSMSNLTDAVSVTFL